MLCSFLSLLNFIFGLIFSFSIKFFLLLKLFEELYSFKFLLFFFLFFLIYKLTIDTRSTLLLRIFQFSNLELVSSVYFILLYIKIDMKFIFMSLFSFAFLFFRLMLKRIFDTDIRFSRLMILLPIIVSKIRSIFFKEIKSRFFLMLN
jgi:hypothetical protein